MISCVGKSVENLRLAQSVVDLMNENGAEELQAQGIDGAPELSPLSPPVRRLRMGANGQLSPVETTCLASYRGIHFPMPHSET